jgi:hypothetical protein
MEEPDRLGEKLTVGTATVAAHARRAFKRFQRTASWNIQPAIDPDARTSSSSSI